MDDKWVLALKDEIVALDENDTWVLINKPSASNVIRCRWVYQIKRNVDGSIERCKARLVTQGFTQHEGIDYSYSYCLVVKPTIVRCVLALAT